MAFSHESVQEAWERQGGRCAACGKVLQSTNRDLGEFGAWHPHHILPQSQEGTDDPNNCAILCINYPNCHFNVGHGGDWTKHAPLSKTNLPYFRFGEPFRWSPHPARTPPWRL